MGPFLKHASAARGPDHALQCLNPINNQQIIKRFRAALWLCRDIPGSWQFNENNMKHWSTINPRIISSLVRCQFGWVWGFLQGFQFYWTFWMDSDLMGSIWNASQWAMIEDAPHLRRGISMRRRPQLDWKLGICGFSGRYGSWQMSHKPIDHCENSMGSLHLLILVVCSTVLQCSTLCLRYFGCAFSLTSTAMGLSLNFSMQSSWGELGMFCSGFWWWETPPSQNISEMLMCPCWQLDRNLELGWIGGIYRLN